jgi:ribosomal protein S18 acetylase RimI-like enzyme
MNSTQNLSPLLKRLDSMSKSVTVIASGLLLLAIFGLDKLSAPHIPFGPYYVLPVALAAWKLSRRYTLTLAIVTSLARVLVISASFPPNAFEYFVADLLTSLLVYIGVALLVLRLRDAYAMLSLHAAKLGEAVRMAENRARLNANIRRAVPTDTDGIVAIVAAPENDAFAEGVQQNEQRAILNGLYTEAIALGRGPRDTWTGANVVVPVEFWVLELGGKIAAFSMVMGMHGPQGLERELHALAVDKTFLGLGVGSVMTDFFCMHYQGRNLYAACLPGSRMGEMLKRRGFSLCGHSKQKYELLERLKHNEPCVPLATSAPATLAPARHAATASS